MAVPARHRQLSIDDARGWRDVERVFRTEDERAVGSLVRVFGDIALAEEAVQDWPQILTLYDQLYSLTPTPVVALNRAMAVTEVHGADAALALVDALTLEDFCLFHAIGADLMGRLARVADAASAYDAAIRRTNNATEQAFLKRRRSEL